MHACAGGDAEPDWEPCSSNPWARPASRRTRCRVIMRRINAKVAHIPDSARAAWSFQAHLKPRVGSLLNCVTDTLLWKSMGLHLTLSTFNIGGCAIGALMVMEPVPGFLFSQRGNTAQSGNLRQGIYPEACCDVTTVMFKSVFHARTHGVALFEPLVVSARYRYPRFAWC